MASTQVVSVSDVMHCAASYGERGSSGYTLSHRQNSGYHRIQNTKRSYIHPADHECSKEHNINNNKGVEKVAKRGTNLQQAQKLHRLGFSYIATSFVYMITKFKTLYNCFLGDVGSIESRMQQGIEVPMAEPYFSVPVLSN